MKSLKHTLLLLLFVTVAPSLWAQPNNEDWNAFATAEFQLQHPTDWELDTSGQMGTVFILLSPAVADKDIQFRENINLVQQSLMDGNMKLEELVALSEEQILSMITDSKIISSKKIRGQQGEYQQVKFTGRQGQLNLVFEQRYWIVNMKAYVLTLTCTETSDAKTVENGLKVLESFSFL